MGKQRVIIYCSRVSSRTALAKHMQKAEHKPRREKSGLTDDDLAEIVAQGLAAEVADREQHALMASTHVVSGSLAELREKVDEEARELRNRCPAVEADLAAVPEHKAQSEWLAALSFKQFRLSSAAQTPATPEDATLTKVERTDRISQAQANLQFVQSLLAPGREVIVEFMARRSFGRERLVALADDARMLVDNIGGTLKPKIKEATQREAMAVKAQKTRWVACFRMIRAAVQGDSELEALFARC